MKLVNDKFRFKSGGLHEKHVVATWILSLVMHSIQPHIIMFRMVLQPIQTLVTIQPDFTVHPASNHFVQNGTAANLASCHGSA